jgi:hypothetical protein
LRSLADLAGAVGWLNQQRRCGKAQQAVERYLRTVTPILRHDLDEYEALLEQLDHLSGGLYSDVERARKRGIGDGRMHMLDYARHHGRALRDRFERLLQLDHVEFRNEWLTTLGSSSRYVQLVSQLVGTFGNFERLLPVLPGVGEMVTSQPVQETLSDMYAINTRNLRLLETIHHILRDWHKFPDRHAWGCLAPQYKVAELVRDMITEYMHEADPAHVRHRRNEARRNQRKYTPYRFLRAATNFRMMAEVKYLDGPRRRPRITRRYVEVDLHRVPRITMDLRRLEWSLKEVFNNALSATSTMFSLPTGEWTALPLPRHNVENPNPAIRVTLEPFHRRVGLRKRPFLRLVILDEGVGIPAHHLPHVCKWGYSPRREEFRRRAREGRITGKALEKEIQIGGKGIGLAYAATVMAEHGGQLLLHSTEGEGTVVSFEFPSPTTLETGE